MIIKVKTLVFCENFMSTEMFTYCKISQGRPTWGQKLKWAEGHSATFQAARSMEIWL